MRQLRSGIGHRGWENPKPAKISSNPSVLVITLSTGEPADSPKFLLLGDGKSFITLQFRNKQLKIDQSEKTFLFQGAGVISPSCEGRTPYT